MNITTVKTWKGRDLRTDWGKWGLMRQMNGTQTHETLKNINLVAVKHCHDIRSIKISHSKSVLFVIIWRTTPDIFFLYLVFYFYFFSLITFLDFPLQKTILIFLKKEETERGKKTTLGTLNHFFKVSTVSCPKMALKGPLLFGGVVLLATYASAISYCYKYAPMGG